MTADNPLAALFPDSHAGSPDDVDGTVASIVVQGVWKSYGGRPAVKGISFTIPPGQVCGYLGPNGAGKTTTIRMLAGILTPDAGTVSICGRNITDGVEAKRQIGYVPESGALYSLLTPREHLDLVSDLHEVDVDVARERQQILLRMFGIESHVWVVLPQFGVTHQLALMIVGVIIGAGIGYYAEMWFRARTGLKKRQD